MDAKIKQLLELETKRKIEKKRFAALEMEHRGIISSIDTEYYNLEHEIIEEMESAGLISEDIDVGGLQNARVRLKTQKPTLIVASDDAVPDEFLRIKKEVNKAKINEAFKDIDHLPNWLVRSEKFNTLEIRFVKKD